MSRKKPRITNDQIGVVVAVSDKLMNGTLDVDVMRIVKESLYRQGRSPTFRYRGRWPYRAFGKPVIRVANDLGAPFGPSTTIVSAKWRRAVALWRKP